MYWDGRPAGERANDELNLLLRARKDPEWFGADTPMLDALAKARGETRVALLEHAVEAMQGQTWPAAAAILFVNDRTLNLTSRRLKVQTEVGIGVETLRTKAGVGEELDIQASLASVIVELAADQTDFLDPAPAFSPEPEVTGAEPAITGTGPGVGGPTERNGRGRLIAAAGVVAVILVAVIALVAVAGDDDTDTTGLLAAAEDADLAAGPVDVTSYCETIEGIGARAEERGDGSGIWDCLGADRSATPADMNAACAYLYGDGAGARENAPGSAEGRWSCIQLLGPADDDGCRVAPGAANPDPSGELETLSEPFAAAAEGTGLGCATNRIHRWQLGFLQDFDNGIIAALDADTVIVLEGEPGITFDRIKGISNEFAGYPTQPSMPQPDGHWAFPLTSGGAMVSDSEAGEYFWIPPVFYPRWVSVGGLTGCLGAPLVEPFTSGSGFVMNFENGSISVNMVTLEPTVDADAC